jgi:nitrate/nitrite transporter NarK
MFVFNEGHVMSDSIQTTYTGDDVSPAGARPDAASARRNVVAVALGNAVEFFDFGTYATFAVMIGHTFFPAKSPFISLLLSVSVFGLGFVVRPLGAVLIGAYADRAGRKPAMMLTLVLMAVGTGAIAVLPGYETLGAARPVPRPRTFSSPRRWTDVAPMRAGRSRHKVSRRWQPV